MYSNNIIFCNNPRCQIDCHRKHCPKGLTCVSMASFGPVNGDSVTKPEDCEMYWEEVKRG